MAKDIRKLKIRHIEQISKLLGPDHILSPESFDLLWECDLDELVDVIHEIEREQPRQELIV